MNNVLQRTFNSTKELILDVVTDIRNKSFAINDLNENSIWSATCTRYFKNDKDFYYEIILKAIWVAEQIKKQQNIESLFLKLHVQKEFEPVLKERSLFYKCHKLKIRLSFNINSNIRQKEYVYHQFDKFKNYSCLFENK